MIKDIEKKCSVGALLYSPALNSKIAQTVIRGDLGNKYSLALCSEDTISPDMVERAELQIEDTMRMLYEALESKELYLPKLLLECESLRKWKEFLIGLNRIRVFLLASYFPNIQYRMLRNTMRSCFG